METIGVKIVEIRKRKGFTQERLSDLSKINLRTLQRIEKGESEPRSDTLKNLCQVLEVKVEELLDYGKKDNLKFLKYFHLSVLTCMFFPLAGIIVPLVLWLGNRHKIIGLNDQGINVLNYQILWSVAIYGLLIAWFIFSINHWHYNYLFLYLMGALYSLNIIYPLIISSLIQKGVVKRFYFNPVQFIK